MGFFFDLAVRISSRTSLKSFPARMSGRLSITPARPLPCRKGLAKSPTSTLLGRERREYVRRPDDGAGRGRRDRAFGTARLFPDQCVFQFLAGAELDPLPFLYLDLLFSPDVSSIPGFFFTSSKVSNPRVLTF